ncbi:MAG: cytochrome c biogenesis protein ResB, partial [Desulfobacteria bacterium]
MKNKKDRGFTEGLSAFFASVKLTIVLLIALAATSIIGTVIPQNEDASAYFQRYGEVFYKIFKFLDIFDMYHSWWFQFLLLMLTINLVVCSFRRLPGVWRIVSVKTPKFSRKRFENIKNK